MRFLDSLGKNQFEFVKSKFGKPSVNLRLIDSFGDSLIKLDIHRFNFIIPIQLVSSRLNWRVLASNGDSHIQLDILRFNWRFLDSIGDS